MRDFLIRSFERLIGAILVLAAVAIVVAAVAANAPTGGQGILVLLVTLLVGALYLVLPGGGMYLVLGIHHNTRRAAEALERGAGR